MAATSHIPSELLKFSTQEKFRAYARFLGIIWRANPWLTGFRFIVLFLGASLQPLEVYFFALFITAIASGNAERAPLTAVEQTVRKMKTKSSQKPNFVIVFLYG